jgi:hypothetical protein
MECVFMLEVHGGFKNHQFGAPLAVAVVLAIAHNASGQSNIRDDAKWSWNENVGWLNWRDADGSMAGVIVDSTVLAGFIWAENVGWISVGDGTPASGAYYANTDGTDFGVNIAADGLLSGFAWGENIGWIDFDTSSLGAPAAHLNLCTKRLHGFAWGENIGWINLDHAEHFVAAVLEADCNSNGYEDACEPDFDNDGLIDDCDDDIDNDGVPNELDACNYTPTSLPLELIEPDGNVLGDLDGDCDVDLADFAIMQARFTGPVSP